LEIKLSGWDSSSQSERLILKLEQFSVEDNTIEILLVEDNPDDVELTLLAFNEYNFANHIHVVRDGAEALDYLFANGQYKGRNVLDKPKVILLDLKLPKIDGLEVLQRVKSDERTGSIPVVVLTTSSESPDINTAYELGVNSYIVKPVDFAQFIEAVRHLGFYWLLLNKSPDPSC
jgi:two-component system, response regulator